MSRKKAESRISSLTLDQRNEISRYGDRLAQACVTLEQVSIEFINWVSKQYFDNIGQWQEAFHVFKDSVSTYGLTKRHKQRIFSQIQDVLVNPHSPSSSVLPQSSKIRTLFLSDPGVESNGYKCSGCGEQGGMKVRCAGKKCPLYLHPMCASSTLQSCRFKFPFYRCADCTSSEVREVLETEGGKDKQKKKFARKKASKSGRKGVQASRKKAKHDHGAGGSLADASDADASDADASNADSSDADGSDANENCEADDDAIGRDHCFGLNQGKSSGGSRADASGADERELGQEAALDQRATLQLGPDNFVNAQHLNSPSTVGAGNCASNSGGAAAEANVAEAGSVTAEAKVADHPSTSSMMVNEAAQTNNSGTTALEKLYFLSTHLNIVVERLSSVQTTDQFRDAYWFMHREQKLPLTESFFSQLSTFVSAFNRAQIACSENATFHDCCNSLETMDQQFPVDPFPTWNLKLCHEQHLAVPELKWQIMRECMALMNHTFDSLKNRNWGLGSKDEFDSLKLPDIEDWFDDNIISNCLKSFSVLREDVLFINPLFCDTINLSDSGNWPVYILDMAKKKKGFAYVAAFVSLYNGQEYRQKRSAGDHGIHWIVVIGDVKQQTSWVYDPLSCVPGRLTSKYRTQLGTLDKFMSAFQKKKFNFTEVACEFPVRCQTGEAVHCGLWCVMYTVSWCLGSSVLHQYALTCSSSMQHNGLSSLAVKFRQRLYHDMVRHHYLLDCTFIDFWRSPVINVRNNFWIATPLKILDYLTIRFGSRFNEVLPRKGFLSKINEGTSSQRNLVENPFFVADGRHVVKVYRFLWGAVSMNLLAKALHESAATKYACNGMDWFHDVFGVVTEGVCASYVYICLCRNELSPSRYHVSGVEMLKIVLRNLFEKSGLVHGDGHEFNMMLRRFASVATDLRNWEAIDFERSFLPNEDADPFTMKQFIDDYASACLRQRASLLDSIKASGLDRTRLKFEDFAKNCLSFGNDSLLFNSGIDDFLRIFKCKSKD
jgi:hypothetical protein